LGLVLFIVASNTQVGWIFLLAGSVFGALASAFWTSRQALRPRQLRVEWPEWTERGQSFTARLHWQEAARGYPAFFQAQAPFAHSQRRARLQPQERQCQTLLVANQRGEWRTLQGEIECFGALAWFPAQRSLTLEANRSLWVLPTLLPLSQSQLRRALHESGTSPNSKPRQGEFRRLREYQQGDDVRLVHWPTSARTGQLVVREFSSYQQPELELLWGASQIDPEHFEWMLNWVYSFWRAAQQAGWKCQLTFWDRDSAWTSTSEVTYLAKATPEISPTPPPARGPRLTFWLGVGSADFSFGDKGIQIGQEPCQCLPG
jgi:uncharacterized protein (DUF58 family)